MANKYTTPATQTIQDIKGRDISVGDLVAYTTNAEGGGFDFGHVDSIFEATGVDRDGDIWYRHKVVMLKTDAFGNPKCHWDWDELTGQRVRSTRQQRSGRVDYYPNKFMVM